MEAGGAWVLSWMLGWAVTDPQRFPGPACGFWVPPPPPRVFWGGPSHACLSPWAPSSWLPSPSTAYCYLQVPGSRVWSILPCGRGISGAPPLHLASVILGTASHLHHCGLAITHPSSASPPSSSPRAHLASRALYMVGFHSFVCTFGEGLLCARPCARHRVNGHCP